MARDQSLRFDFYWQPKAQAIFESWFNEMLFSDRTEALNRLVIEFARLRTLSGQNQDFLARKAKA